MTPAVLHIEGMQYITNAVKYDGGIFLMGHLIRLRSLLHHEIMLTFYEESRLKTEKYNSNTKVARR